MTKTAHELAEEWVDSNVESCCGTSDIIIVAEKAYLAGHAQALKDERERIWNICKQAQIIAEFPEINKLAGGVRMSELQQIIFGDGK